MAYTFILSDESINSYGLRVLTAGIDLTNFRKNPIMYWNHSRSWRGTKDEVLPIGKWENIRVEGANLMADAVFDEKDEFAQRIKSKVDQKIINMASAGLRIIATSEDKAVLLKGQTRPTVVQSVMREASIVDEGSNKSCLRLWDAFDDEINLSAGGENHLLPLIDLINMEFKEQVRGVLKLSAQATDAEILAALQAGVNPDVNLQEQVDSLTGVNANLKAELQVFKDAAELAEKQKGIDLVDQAIADRKITGGEKETYLALVDKDFENTKKLLDAKEPAPELGGGSGGSDKNDPWDERFREIEKATK